MSHAVSQYFHVQSDDLMFDHVFYLCSFTLVFVCIPRIPKECFPLSLNYLLKTGLTRSQQDISAILNIKSNQSQKQSDWFDGALSLVLSKTFVLSLYKRDITRMVGRYVHSTTTHTSLLKTHLIFNNKTLKKIQQFMYN